VGVARECAVGVRVSFEGLVSLYSLSSEPRLRAFRLGLFLRLFLGSG